MSRAEEVEVLIALVLFPVVGEGVVVEGEAVLDWDPGSGSIADAGLCALCGFPAPAGVSGDAGSADAIAIESSDPEF